MTAASPSAFGNWVTVQARRLLPGPIIGPGLFANPEDSRNINGPCLIRVPAWVTRPWGRYYLYFAHHQGKYVRLAYADALTGPWKLHEGGVLSLGQLAVPMGHIASPEVLVDNTSRRLVLFFHGTVADRSQLTNPNGWGGQLTFAATSADGLAFTPGTDVIASFYLRVFRHGDWWYGVCKDANVSNQLARGASPLSGLAPGPRVLPNGRHVGLLLQGDTLWVFYSRAGDCPEHILMTRFDLAQDWATWGEHAPPPVSVLKPDADWEGTCYPLTPSRWGAGIQVREVRDPYLFDDEGRLYLLYSVAGEMGIGIAELEFQPPENGPQPAVATATGTGQSQAAQR